jgi:hypothetical protein
MSVKYKIYRSFIIFPALLQRYNLTATQFMVIDSVRYLSTHNPMYSWCTTNKNDIAKFCGTSVRTVLRAIKLGKSLGLIEVNVEGYGIKTTEKWNAKIKILDTKQNDQDDALADKGDEVAVTGDNVSVVSDNASAGTDKVTHNNIKNNINIKRKNKKEENKLLAADAASRGFSSFPQEENLSTQENVDDIKKQPHIEKITVFRLEDAWVTKECIEAVRKYFEIAWERLYHGVECPVWRKREIEQAKELIIKLKHVDRVETLINYIFDNWLQWKKWWKAADPSIGLILKKVNLIGEVETKKAEAEDSAKYRKVWK